MKNPEYRFTDLITQIFLTGAPLSGKSTIAPLVAACIEGCSLQSMDIIRLLAQNAEELKPRAKRNPFVNYGSCDSYKFIEDGSYTPENLIAGFNAYSSAVTSLLTRVVPKLEAQGVSHLLFEGVQLTPSLIAPFLVGNSKLIIAISNEAKLRDNREKLFGNNPEMNERYSTEKLLIIQDEILRQSESVPPDKRLYIDNIRSPIEAALAIIKFLETKGAIRKHNELWGDMI